MLKNYSKVTYVMTYGNSMLMTYDGRAQKSEGSPLAC